MKYKKYKLMLFVSFGVVFDAHANQYMLSESDGLWVAFGTGAGIISEKNHLNERVYKDSGFTSKLELGYDLNPNFGTYITYDYFDKAIDNRYLHIGGLGVRGRGYFTERLSIFVKAGANYLIKGHNDHGPIGSIGFGAEYNLSNSTSIKTGFDYFNDLEIASDRIGDLSQWYLGFSYRFGQPDTPMLVEVIETKEVIKEVEVVKFIENQPKVYSIGGNQLFENNSSALLVQESLDGFLNLLKNDGNLKLKINGYTDNVGTDHYNLWLSERRARSVATFFIDNGIDEKRLDFEGLGNSNPVASNDTEFGRSLNRRVELEIK